MADLTLEEAAYLAELKQGLADIKAHPEHWDQTTWACGTSYCLAGFCQLRRDNLSPGDRTGSVGTPRFADEYPRGWGADARIFDGRNTIEGIERAIERLEEKGFQYDAHGYDARGYDKRGYAEDGYDRFNLNRKGEKRPTDRNN